MRRLQLTLAFLFVVSVNYGCSSINVSSDYAPDIDFSKITTYAWKNAEVKNDALEANPLLKKRVQFSVENYLAQKGYKKVAPVNPDVFLVIHAGFREKMRVTNWGGPSGYYADPWYNPWWDRGGYYGNRVDVSYYTEGTLVIDIVAADTRELIWRGVGTGIVREYSDLEKMQQEVDTYVSEILDRFPPGQQQ